MLVLTNYCQLFVIICIKVKGETEIANHNRQNRESDRQIARKQEKILLMSHYNL
ncbi:hypothetical protein M2451_000415 [Dysgonomonas sp. PFB1-18]|nr:hypothetical protein [Dysgonomonas sp. PF1-14]MDH6337184.1 hypothetical protein [Dysgonomonas sp. PF1-16]MDH6379108.1 hypothetical protein [Dysgonomonas sp. PFB1-18]MDH6396255.1 hypothetical protein [Dysgonomonas sp. PF1-23]